MLATIAEAYLLIGDENADGSGMAARWIGIRAGYI
jgi:hypothetical protein